MSDSPTDARPPKPSFPASPLSSSTAPTSAQGAWEGTFERSKTVSGAVITPSVNASSSSAEAASNKAYAAAAAAATVVVAADSEDVSLTAPFNLAGTSPPDGSSAASAGLQLPPSHMQARSQSAKRSPRPSTASLAEGRLVNIPDALDDMDGMSAAAVGRAREGSSAEADLATSEKLGSNIDFGTPSTATSAATAESQTSSSVYQLRAEHPGYDWPTFIIAYAAGRWNPHRTPTAPRPSTYFSQSSSWQPTLPHQLSASSSHLEGQGNANIQTGSSSTRTPPTLTSLPPLPSTLASIAPSPTGRPGTDSSASASDLSGSVTSASNSNSDRERPSSATSVSSSVDATSAVALGLESWPTTPQPQAHPAEPAYAMTLREASPALPSSPTSGQVQAQAPEQHRVRDQVTTSSLTPSPASAPSPASPDVLSFAHRRASESAGSSSMASGRTMRIAMPPPPASAASSVAYHRARFDNTHPTPSVLRPPILSPLPSPAVLGYSVTAGTTGGIGHEGASGSGLASGASTPDVTTAAAAMRWAASSHPSIAPLALPSPEHELMDPMRGMTVSLPVDASGRRTSADFSSAEEEDEDGHSSSGARRRWAAYSYNSRSSVGRSAGRVIRNVRKKTSLLGKGDSEAGDASGSGSGDKTSSTRRIWEKFTRDGRSEEKRRSTLGSSSLEETGAGSESGVGDVHSSITEGPEGEGNGSIGGSDETEKEPGSLEDDKEDDGGGLHIPSEPRQPPIQPPHPQARTRDAAHPQQQPRLRVIAVAPLGSCEGGKPQASPREKRSPATSLATIEASPLPSPIDERPSMMVTGDSTESNGSGDSEQTTTANLKPTRENRQHLHLAGRSASYPKMGSAPAPDHILSEGGEEPDQQVDYFGFRNAMRAKSGEEHALKETGSSSSDQPSPSTSSLSGPTDLSASQTSSGSSREANTKTSGSDESGTAVQTSRSSPLPTIGTITSGSPGQAWSVPSTPLHKGVLNRQTSSPLPSRPYQEDVSPPATNVRGKQFLEAEGHVIPGRSEPVAPSVSQNVSPESHNMLGNAAPLSQSLTDETSKRPFTSGTVVDLPFRGSQEHRHMRVGSTFAAPGGKGQGMAVVTLRPTLSRAQSLKTMGSAVRVSHEEEEFVKRGYLVPPYPKDEEIRRRALHKFNIMHTTPDVNFDRIAYLTKLVFSTKIVVVSLVDGTEEWYKMESGLGLQSSPRQQSFSAHAILQRGEEPTVVLDTYRDWRFSGNPLVASSPNVRFFAAAPLRTSEGQNVGALCIMDDHPRTEFTPRQRHTLKEFAAIVMREMELWKDKIQLQIRDRIQNSMEQFTRECLEIDNEAETNSTHSMLKMASMDKVYERAAKLVKRTLDVEGAVVMDVSHFDVLETTKAEGAISIVCHHGDATVGTTTHSIPTDEYPAFMEFFSKHPEGKIAEYFVPKCFRSLLPGRIQHALIVPIFNIDKRPFALLCAYNTTEHVKPFLEGHELSYLRAIGVIILSAVLKRRMILADKSKSLFISNISHELRTPLHGILAAAELLADTDLDDNQSSFLRTVQACGTSLVETVNHVLDFTKLSGNQKGGGVENVIMPSKVDLSILVEEAVEGCYIGYRARPQVMGSEIGSLYAPSSQNATLSFGRSAVEMVIDINFRSKGWQLICEKGGLRRILMNLIGNSLKFTTSGYVLITLRQLPPSKDTNELSPGKDRIELSVVDTGKGISKDFLKNQLFHPFSQENPLQSGTGLGLAIVNSIVRSESVNGQVDVSSTEGVGTEIRITFDAVTPDDDASIDIEKIDMHGKRFSVSLFGFDDGTKGTILLRTVIEKYLKEWWGFDILSSDSAVIGDILMLNEETDMISKALECRDISKPFVLLSSSRADSEVMSKAYDYERLGGFCRMVSKPAGPSRLRQVLKASVHLLTFRESSTRNPPTLINSPDSFRSAPLSMLTPDLGVGSSNISRRTSQENREPVRPRMHPRAATFHPIMPSSHTNSPSMGNIRLPTSEVENAESSPSGDGTINVGAGGTLLKSSVGTLDCQGRVRVLVVEDNQILRDLLVRWLGNKGYDFEDAIDGREGVNAFEKDEYFDVVLLDLSMPVLDGISATTEIRQIESRRRKDYEESPDSDIPRPRTSKILALTGMSSLEDKRRAFEAGVDGYLVKPVAFKTLDAMFHQLGVT